MKAALLAVIAAGILVRLKAYLATGSLMIDEANLARNLAERGFTGLWHRLAYEQYAPPVFMALSKGAGLIAGYHELSLRLIPLIAGALCFWLIYELAEYYFDRTGWGKVQSLLILILYGFSYSAIVYSNQFKQYSSDLFVALLLTVGCLKMDYHRATTWQGAVIWALAGTVCIWSSMPSVFVLASIAAYYFLGALKQGKAKQFLLYFTLPSVIWIANFLIYFFFILKADAESDYLQNYHADYFLPHEMWKAESWRTLWKIIRENIGSYIGGTAITIAWTLLFFAWGVTDIIRARERKGVLLLLPVLLTCIASVLRYYSLMPRLNLFMFAFFLAILISGIRACWRTQLKWLQFVTVLSSLVVIAGLNWKLLIPGKHPIIEETREVMDAVADSIRDGDAVFVNHEGAPAVKFYVQHYSHQQRYRSFQGFRPVNWDENIVDEASSFLNANPGKRLWVLWGHTPDEIINEEAARLQENLSPAYDADKWRARALCLVKPD